MSQQMFPSAVKKNKKTQLKCTKPESLKAGRAVVLNTNQLALGSVLGLAEASVDLVDDQIWL